MHALGAHSMAALLAWHVPSADGFFSGFCSATCASQPGLTVSHARLAMTALTMPHEPKSSLNCSAGVLGLALTAVFAFLESVLKSLPQLKLKSAGAVAVAVAAAAVGSTFDEPNLNTGLPLTVALPGVCPVCEGVCVTCGEPKRNMGLLAEVGDFFGRRAFDDMVPPVPPDGAIVNRAGVNADDAAVVVVATLERLPFFRMPTK